MVQQTDNATDVSQRAGGDDSRVARCVEALTMAAWKGRAFGFSLYYSFDSTKTDIGAGEGGRLLQKQAPGTGDLLLTLLTVFLLRLVTAFTPALP